MLFDAATRAGLAVEFLTAPEVYDGLLTAKEKPVVDLVGTYLQEERPKSALKAHLDATFDLALRKSTAVSRHLRQHVKRWTNGSKSAPPRL